MEERDEQHRLRMISQNLSSAVVVCMSLPSVSPGDPQQLQHCSTAASLQTADRGIMMHSYLDTTI